jgi:hypothetical protein
MLRIIYTWRCQAAPQNHIPLTAYIDLQFLMPIFAGILLFYGLANPFTSFYTVYYATVYWVVISLNIYDSSGLRVRTQQQTTPKISWNPGYPRATAPVIRLM